MMHGANDTSYSSYNTLIYDDDRGANKYIVTSLTVIAIAVNPVSFVNSKKYPKLLSPQISTTTYHIYLSITTI